MIFNMELTHLGSEASKYDINRINLNPENQILIINKRFGINKSVSIDIF